MDFIPIADDKLINIDLIEGIEIRKNKKTGEKTIVITTVGGKQHLPEVDNTILLNHLIKAGAGKATSQFFSV